MERPPVPKSMTDISEHLRKLADAIVWLMNRNDELERRIKALGG